MVNAETKKRILLNKIIVSYVENGVVVKFYANNFPLYGEKL